MAPRYLRGVLLAALAALLQLGCDEGTRTEDAPPGEQNGVAGDGLRLAELNDPGNPRPPVDRDLLVTGAAVVAVDRFDETQDGASIGNVYAQDMVDEQAPHQSCAEVVCEYSGITVYDPSYSPPALRVAAGDVVDIRGRYEEFLGPGDGFGDGRTLPEIGGGTLSLRFEYQDPEPVTIDLTDLKSYDTGRKWIGMLVRVENARIFMDGSKSDAGRFTARLDVGAGVTLNDVPTLTNALFPLDETGLPLTSGTTYRSIVGVVQYFYNFSIAPRSAEDLTQ